MQQRIHRVVIENGRPEMEASRIPVKRTAGEKVQVTAAIHAHGHDLLSDRVLHCTSIAYSKVGGELSNVFQLVVNLDPHHA